MQKTFQAVQQRCSELVDFVHHSRKNLSPHDSCALHLKVPARTTNASLQETLQPYAIQAPQVSERSGASQTLRPAMFGTSEFSGMSIETLHEGYRQREFSVTEVITSLLSTIDELNPELRAFSTVFHDEALNHAGELDKQLDDGITPTGLFGIPVGIKDIIDMQGKQTTLGSYMYRDEIAQADADVVHALRQHSALLIGKTTTHELAFGATSGSAFHGPVRNPYDKQRISGGSSGGSAVAVSAGMVPLSIGTDTGGSIRIPAAACGVVGLKPTYGAVSTTGVRPLSFSLDHVGPFGRTVDDVARLFDVIRRPRADHNGLKDQSVHTGSGRDPILGVPEHWLDAARIQDDVWKIFHQSLLCLQEAGARIVSLPATHLPDYHDLVAANRVIIMAEGASQHAHLLDATDLVMDEEIQTRLRIGSALPASAYINAQRIRKVLNHAFDTAIAGVDAMVLPTLPVVAPCVGENDVALSGHAREDIREALIRFTSPLCLTGHPAISIPAGLSREGLPVAVQLVGHYHQEDRLMQLARLLPEL